VIQEVARQGLQSSDQGLAVTCTIRLFAQ